MYFDQPVRQVKIQTTGKNTQLYYTAKRLIRDLLSKTPNCHVCAGEFYRECEGMRSGMELAREVQLTDWSVAGIQGKLVFVVSTASSLSQLNAIFTTGKIVFRSSKLHINSIFHFEISVKKKMQKKFGFDNNFFFGKKCVI